MVRARRGRRPQPRYLAIYAAPGTTYVREIVHISYAVYMYHYIMNIYYILLINLVKADRSSEWFVASGRGALLWAA